MAEAEEEWAVMSRVKKHAIKIGVVVMITLVLVMLGAHKVTKIVRKSRPGRTRIVLMPDELEEETAPIVRVSQTGRSPLRRSTAQPGGPPVSMPAPHAYARLSHDHVDVEGLVDVLLADPGQRWRPTVDADI